MLPRPGSVERCGRRRGSMRLRGRWVGPTRAVGRYYGEGGVPYRKYGWGHRETVDLHDAAKRGDFDSVAELIDDRGVDPSAKGNRMLDPRH